MSKLRDLITKSDTLISTTALAEKNEHGVQNYNALIAELTSALEAAIDPLMRCAYSWGTENDDACGFCHKHFAECEEELLAVGDDTENGIDIPTGREFACPGARARRVLNGLSQLCS